MIGVFDSGAGGLTILSAIRSSLPNSQLVYLADHAYSPYGDLGESQVLERSRLVTEWLLEKGCTLIVVACNTATAIAIDQLRQEFEIPIVGVEPGIKPAALESQSLKIGILATENTLASKRYSDLMSRFLPNVQVINQGCSGLADAIESSPEIIPSLVTKYAQPLIEEGIDQLVLGCTHYPLIKHILRGVVGAEVEIIDTSEAISQEVVRRYSDIEAQTNASAVELNTTGQAGQLKQVVQRFSLLNWLENTVVSEVSGL